MNKTIDLILKLDTHNTSAAIINPQVSAASVGWHLSHSYLVINQISGAMVASVPGDYERKFNLKRFIIFITGKIPRGKAKAPKAVTPINIDSNAIITLHTKALDNLKLLKTLPKNSYFKHPYFGHLNVPQTAKFLALHTKHHLNIVTDILTKEQL